MNRFLRTLCVLVMLAVVAPAWAATDVDVVGPFPQCDRHRQTHNPAPG